MSFRVKDVLLKINADGTPLLGIRELWFLSHLVNHFRTDHIMARMENSGLDWTTDMIELPKTPPIANPIATFKNEYTEVFLLIAGA